jgi:hypothetical protein
MATKKLSERTRVTELTADDLLGVSQADGANGWESKAAPIYMLEPVVGTVVEHILEPIQTEFQGLLDSANKAAQDAAASASEAAEDLETISNNAAQAVSKANQALEEADAAHQDAAEAVAAAQGANSTASEAQTAAQNAQTAAQNAATASQNAQAAAQEAQATASGLSSSIETAQSTADQSIETANAAAAAALNATNAAANANTNADNAVQTANAATEDLEQHTSDTGNPHGVTAAQVGLGNVDNTADADKPVSTAQATAIGEVSTALSTHTGDTDNPHSVTKAQVGLGNVDNTADADKPVSTAQSSALNAEATLRAEADEAAITRAEFEPVPNEGTHEDHLGEQDISLDELHIKFSGDDRSDPDNIESVLKTDLHLKAAPGETELHWNDYEGARTLTISAPAISGHTSDTNNPHSVTKAQVGLGNVDNTADADKPVSTAQATAIIDKCRKAIKVDAHSRINITNRP